MAGLVALGVLVAGLVVAVILYSADHWVLGILLGMSAIPIALIAWVAMKERV
jgi:hypothetical protein